MLRTKKMKKVRVIVLKSQAADLIRELHEAGLVDIRKGSHDGLDEGRPLASFDEVSVELVKLRAALSVMEQAVGPGYGRAPKLMDGGKALAASRALQIGEKLKGLSAESADLGEEVKALEAQKAALARISHFKSVDFSRLSTRTMGFRIADVPVAKLSRLEEAVKAADGNMILEPGFNVALILFPRKSQQAVDGAMAEYGAADVEVPEGMTTPAAMSEAIGSRLSAKKERLAAIRAEIARIAKAEIERVRDISESLEVMATRAEVASRFSQTRRVFVLEGWIVGSEMGKLKELVSRHPEVSLEDVHVDEHHEMPPTVLDNPKVAGPMEFITKNYSFPNYFELDPTFAYLIALPILYGMIVGDVIYGLISLVLAFWFLQKFRKSYIMSNVSKIWMYSAVPAIAFGLFFDEWAGMSHFKLAQLIGSWIGVTILNAPLYTGFARIENVLALIGLSALAGMIHLAFGFIFGAVNEWHHDKKHSMAKVAWIGVELGMLLALLPYLTGMFPQLGRIDPSLTPVGLVLLVVSVVVIGATEGVVGVIEIPGLVGNILSYSRIAAIGIVGVVIAELLNDFIVPTPDKGLVLALVLAPVFIILHVVNCFVAMFESLIQGGRLNIVEFRSKFLQGGGDLFIPFSLYSKKL